MFLFQLRGTQSVQLVRGGEQGGGSGGGRGGAAAAFQGPPTQAQEEAQETLTQAQAPPQVLLQERTVRTPTGLLL